MLAKAEEMPQSNGTGPCAISIITGSFWMAAAMVGQRGSRCGRLCTLCVESGTRQIGAVRPPMKGPGGGEESEGRRRERRHGGGQGWSGAVDVKADGLLPFAKESFPYGERRDGQLSLLRPLIADARVS